MLTAKAAWEVRAGLVPGTALPEYTKRWSYTSADYESDGKHADEPQYMTLFNRMQFEAMSYHLQMSNPKLNNWAQLSFLWY